MFLHLLDWVSPLKKKKRKKKPRCQMSSYCPMHHHSMSCHRSHWELEGNSGRKVGNCIHRKNTFVSGISVGGGRHCCCEGNRTHSLALPSM